MNEIGQRYIWTVELVPKDRPNSPCLKLKRIPAPDCSTSSSLSSRFGRPSNPPPDAPSNFPPTSVSSPISKSSPSSSSSCCSSCCSCSCSSPCACSSSFSSSSLSRRLSTCSAPSSPLGRRYPAQETENWTCEIVDGHRKVILRRQLSDSSVLRAETDSQPATACPCSAPQRRFRGSLEKTPL